MDNEDYKNDARWGMGILALSMATAFIYFLILKPEESSRWLSDNVTLSWTILGISMTALGGYLFFRSKRNDHATYDRIRSGVYAILGVTILLAVVFG